jgi:hypothetical protein
MFAPFPSSAATFQKYVVPELRPSTARSTRVALVGLGQTGLPRGLAASRGLVEKLPEGQPVGGKIKQEVLG